jgi:hypothetical protein
MTASARQDLAVAASLLEQGRTLDALSRLLTAAALVTLPLLAAVAPLSAAIAWIVLGLTIAVGLGEIYVALRVGLDAAIFRALASQETGPDLPALDRSLQGQGLLPPHKSGRPVEERIAGARRLLTRQAALLVAQVAVLIVGAIVMAVR